MERKDLVRHVLQAASDFNARRLWKRFSNFDCFAVKISDRREWMLGVVMGDAGEQFGLSLFRGERAAASLAAILDPDGPGDDATEDTDMVGFTMDTFGELTAEMQQLIREAGLHPRYTDEVPGLLAKPPGRRPRMPHDSELALLLMVLRGTIEADQRKLLHPSTLDVRLGVCTLVLTGDPATPQVAVTRERWQPPEVPQTIPFPSEIPDLGGLPHLDETWLVGLFVLPAAIEGDDRCLQLLLVAEDASRFVLQARPIFAGELDEATKSLTETLRGANMGGRKGLPREIVFSSRKLHDAMAPILRQAGVACVYMPTIPKLQEIAADLLGGFGERAPSFLEHLEAADAQPALAPDDLAGWKEADRRLGRRFAVFVESDGRFRAARAVKRYFGRDDLKHFLEAHASRSVVQAYALWVILDYRPTKKSKTPAERMLAEGLPEAEALLLRARIEAHPTLYRVAGHDPKAGTVRLEDVLLGGEVTVCDQLLSENIEDGVFITARAYPAGRFHFLELAGPPLGAGMGLEAVEFLQDGGLEFTRDGLRRDAHLFGRLWDWADEWKANRQPPRLCNTDGDDLLWHTASFHVASPQAVRQALRERQDVEYDEGNDQFVWIGGTARGRRTLGGPVTLGRIEFVGDELVLSVNSARRFKRARKWLEKLPGVVFCNVTTRRLDEPDEKRPMDERISRPEPVEMTPPLIAGMQDMLDKQYVRWLDERLPILGGKTPRQACATPAGRQQVAILIRTLPDPMGPSPVHVPRQAMLRDLGLAADLSPEPVSSPPMAKLSRPPEAASADRRIGRNDPCPCGSGKKYKKCCGRRIS